MSDQFVAEIRMFPGTFAPSGWALCNGQLMPISQNTALFSLLGTTYGGDGKSTFGLPNLQGSVAMHTTAYSSGNPFGQFDLGQTGGEDSITLSSSEMPSHTHNVQADANHANALSAAPGGGVPGNANPTATFSVSSSPQLATMNFNMVGVAGGGQPHNNLMPYLTLNYCIALQGIFPPRS
jgi:microcystin-dependent protein